MMASWTDLCPACLHPWWAHADPRWSRTIYCVGQGCRCTDTLFVHPGS
jgi:hypothetical protein